MSAVTTHVLDTVLGLPATGLKVRLERLDGVSVHILDERATGDDGRIRELGPEALPTGVYRLSFETGKWFAEHERPTFFPEVAVTFEMADGQGHLHVPLLLAPFAYSTYRGA
jgi:5-hydroxyisourate hydrolase